MKRKLPMVTNAQLELLEEFDGRHREIETAELASPSHRNVSVLVSRMVRYRWLQVTGHYENPANGTRARIVAITNLGRAARAYGRAERARRRR